MQHGFIAVKPALPHIATHRLHIGYTYVVAHIGYTYVVVVVVVAHPDTHDIHSIHRYIGVTYVK